MIQDQLPCFKLTALCKYGHQYYINITRDKLSRCTECGAKKKAFKKKIVVHSEEAISSQNKLFEGARKRLESQGELEKSKSSTSSDDKGGLSKGIDLNDFSPRYWLHNQNLFPWIRSQQKIVKKAKIGILEYQTSLLKENGSEMGPAEARSVQNLSLQTSEEYKKVFWMIIVIEMSDHMLKSFIGHAGPKNWLKIYKLLMLCVHPDKNVHPNAGVACRKLNKIKETLLGRSCQDPTSD